ncbi:MAG TPA: glycosyltransferase [Patescibacteria group bacterium]|nr:glycosyltransferase [Patescibacteria group bacterium]
MISINTLVKNEENFLWYSVGSVVNYVDEILLWDTGSTDQTLKIIEEIIKRYPHKIHFKQIGRVDPEEYSGVRQQMLDNSIGDWVFILDGDEVWWDENIKKISSFINSNKVYESVVVKTYNLIGDMFHFQEENAGMYRFGKRRGHFALRFMNKNIPGLHVGDVYGKEGFFDGDGLPIQNRDESKIMFFDLAYVHATHLTRSTKDFEVMQRDKKKKYERGIEFAGDFYFPEVFFREKPEIVPNNWENTQLGFKVKAYLQTPLKKIKRRI